jgi:hypothetical protein
VYEGTERPGWVKEKASLNISEERMLSCEINLVAEAEENAIVNSSSIEEVGLTWCWKA